MKGRKLWIRAVIVIVILLVGWVAYISSKQLERNRRIQKEVATLSEEAAKIRRENETLGDRINYFSSNEFREQEAKEKLGMKKPDETVMVVQQEPDPVATENKDEQQNTKPLSPDEGEGNYKKWWNLFFNKT
ncbi:MAG: septum formation initiator family protein [Patescibacteria group bacterium]